MRTLAVALLLTFPALSFAQEDLTVLKADADGVPPRKMLHQYLLGQARKHFDARRQTIAGLKSSEDIQRRQDELRKKFIDALGGFPEKTPLNAKVVGTQKCDGYRVENVVFESRPNHHVTANFYVPDGKGPFPAVLVPCGHTNNGKAGYQQVCIILAKHGLAALCYDPIGQGERLQLPLESGKPAIAGTNEHTMVGVGALLVGRCTASYRVWDGIRGIDYLCSRPEIDAKKIGCTGSSGGGTLTSYLMALDDRVAAAAPSCYITTLEKLFATLGPQDGEQNIPGQVAFGMEHADYLFLRVPRPTLLLTATRDFFDIGGSWTTYREAKQIYGIAGFGERVDLFEYNTTHGYPQPQREAMVRFMRRWLLDKHDPVTEAKAETLKEQQLWCTRTGQVLEDLKGKSVFDLNTEQELALAKERAQWLKGRPNDDIRKEVRRLLAVPEKVPAAKLRDVGKIERKGYEIRKLVFDTEAGISVPALWFVTPKKADVLPCIVYLHGDGKAADAAVGGPIEKLVLGGSNVLALDVRGIGELAPGTADPKRPNYFGVEFKESFLAMHVGRPLLGQRVLDVISVVASLEETPLRSSTFQIIGVGSAGPIALHVAALDPHFQAVTLDRSLASWSSVVRTAISHNQLANVVPGVLKFYDLSDLDRVTVPGKVERRNPVDAVNKPIAQAPPLKNLDLPKVVLIGDSIRMGYAPLVAKKLEGKAIVISDKENGGDSANVLKHLDEWASAEKPAVVHFNCGLHDLKTSRKTKQHQIALPQYEANLKQILARLKKDTTASIVFASTTPILDDRHAARKGDFDRIEADVQRYNTAATALMREAGIVVHDLHWVVEKGGTEKMLGGDGTHYTAAGNERLAEAVADCILRQLIAISSKPTPPPPSGPEAAAAYRKQEKERDAEVPELYKKMPIGTFQLPSSASAWKEQRPDVLKKVVQSLGDLPPRPSPQKVRLVTRELRHGYTLEKIAIDNGVDGEVTALLLIPEKRPNPAPAILWLHSSTPDKTQVIVPNTNGGELSLGEAFVRAGYVVLSPDAYWHGDRLGTGPAGSFEKGSRSGEQESLFKYHLWMGRTLWGMFVRDDQIALDYLCTRPEVDTKRIGATGMSMGGTRTWWLAAVDERISCAVTMACLTRYQNLIAHGQLRAHGVYYFVHGLLRHFDTEAVVALTAPRPFLALTGDLDHGSPADGIKVIEEKVSRVYDTVGAKEKFKNVLYPETGHVVTPQMRADMLEWFERWLKQ
ncbi:MAG: acetylxylan esterase [Gemmataceae bacterium]|nr:acetylxylan esterase [Gemmataceae bacterium]